MYEGDIFNTSIVEEKFYNVIITNLTVGNTRINMDCKEVSQTVHVVVVACGLRGSDLCTP